jgi:hypothetical protein
VSDRRISLQECFDRLLPHYKPAVACELINLAVRENRLRLYCDSTLLALSYVCSSLCIVIEQEADGRWRCRVLPAGPGLGFDPNRPYRWEVDDEGIADLLPPPSAAPTEPSQSALTELTDALKRWPAELAAALKPPAEAENALDKNKGWQPSLQKQMAEAIIKRRYPDGVPAGVRTATVHKEIGSDWPAECTERKYDPKKPPAPAPSPATVRRMLGRGE